MERNRGDIDPKSRHTQPYTCAYKHMHIPYAQNKDGHVCTFTDDWTGTDTQKELKQRTT